MSGGALICAPPGATADALTQALNEAGFACVVAYPSDDKRWCEALDAAGELRALVHAVPPPAHQFQSFAAFTEGFEHVLGSLWLGASRAMPRLRAAGGGVIIAWAPAAGDEPFAAMYGDGIRALVACLGIAEASGPGAVRAASLSLPLAVLRGTSEAAASVRAAEMTAFLAGSDASYLTATDIALGVWRQPRNKEP